MRIDKYIPVNNKNGDFKLEEDQYYPFATRRPRLTLIHLNKLRKIREKRKLERLKREKAVATIYWPIGDIKEDDEKDET